MDEHNEKIYVLDKDTREEVIPSYATVKALRNYTGWGADKVYRLLKTKADQQKGVVFPRYDNLVLITRQTSGLKLTPADPDALYTVSDDTLVYHIGTLAECTQMKKQLGFTTLKVKLWQTTQHSQRTPMRGS